MQISPVEPIELAALRTELERSPRLAGYYLIRMVRFTPGAAPDREAELDAIFQALDDRPWPSLAERAALATPGWTTNEVSAASATALAVDALVGGPAIGHVAATIPGAQAEDCWRRFCALFSDSARYYAGLGLGDPAYVYLGGVAIVDTDRAGFLGVIESD